MLFFSGKTIFFTSLAKNSTFYLKLNKFYIWNYFKTNEKISPQNKIMQNLNYYPASNSYLVNDQHTSLPTSSTFKYNTSYYGDYNSYNDSYNISPASSTSSSSSSPFSSFSSNDHNSTYSNYNHPMSYTTNANTTTTTATAYPTSNNYTAAYNSYYPMYSYYNQTTPYQSSSPYFCTQRSDSLDTPPMSNISTASSFNSSWDQNCLDTQQQQPARNIINEIDGKFIVYGQKFS